MEKQTFWVQIYVQRNLWPEYPNDFAVVIDLSPATLPNFFVIISCASAVAVDEGFARASDIRVKLWCELESYHWSKSSGNASKILR